VRQVFGAISLFDRISFVLIAIVGDEIAPKFDVLTFNCIIVSAVAQSRTATAREFVAVGAVGFDG